MAAVAAVAQVVQGGGVGCYGELGRGGGHRGGFEVALWVGRGAGWEGGVPVVLSLLLSAIW